MSSAWKHITSARQLAMILASGDSGTFYLPGRGFEGAPADGIYRLERGVHVLWPRQTLIFAPGVRLGAARGGAAFEARGRLQASLDQHIFEAGTGDAVLTVRCVSGSVEQVSPQWWGAALGLGISDADAIEQMLASIEVDGVDTVVFPSTSGFVLDRTVHLVPGKRYLATQAVLLPSSPQADPLFALSPTGLMRTELTGFRFDGAGRPITLLRVAPNLDDLVRTLGKVQGADLVGREALAVSPTSVSTPAFALTPPGSPTHTAPLQGLVGPRTLRVHRCDFRDAAVGIATHGSFDGQLSDCTLTGCEVGLDLEVVDGQLALERIAVRPSAPSERTSVRLRLRAGRLLGEALTVDGALEANVRAGELELRGGRLGFASFGPLSDVADTQELSKGRVVVRDCIFDGAAPIETPVAEVWACAHIRLPNEVEITGSHFHFHDHLGLADFPPLLGGTAGKTTHRAGLVVDWGGQTSGTVLLDGCEWDAAEDLRSGSTSVALWNLDLPLTTAAEVRGERPLHTHQLIARSCIFSQEFGWAMRMDGGSVELDGCLIEGQRALWGREFSWAALQVLTVRSPAFQPQPGPALWARLDASPSPPAFVLVHQDVLLDDALSRIETATVGGPSITTVGGRVVEGHSPSPDALSGLSGDLYRGYPVSGEHGGDSICIKTGEDGDAVWVKYCRNL